MVRHLIFRVPERGHNFDNHPIEVLGFGARGGQPKAMYFNSLQVTNNTQPSEALQVDYP